MLAFAATTALALQLPCGAPPRTRPLRMQLTDQEQKISEAMEIKPVSAESARSTGLALALDDGTRKSHSVAENTAFVTGFFRGIATKQAFGQLVASLYFVYEAMETAFTECDDEGVRALDYPQLRRRAALEEDMAYYFGPEWRDSVQPSAATRKYVARVEEVAREAPYLLIAHMYTRYLGDLFGGQMMGGMARRSLDLDASLGTKFYEFDDIANTKQCALACCRSTKATSLRTPIQRRADGRFFANRHVRGGRAVLNFRMCPGVHINFMACDRGLLNFILKYCKLFRTGAHGRIRARATSLLHIQSCHTRSGSSSQVDRDNYRFCICVTAASLL